MHRIVSCPNSMSFLSALNNLLLKMHDILFQEGVDYFEIEYKSAILG